jgi:hypothetical protein
MPGLASSEVGSRPGYVPKKLITCGGGLTMCQQVSLSVCLSAPVPTYTLGPLYSHTCIQPTADKNIRENLHLY